MRALVGHHALGFLTGAGLMAAVATGCGDPDDPDGSGGGGSGATSATGGTSWCEVSQVLEAKCRRCHVGEGLNGAPFPLVTYQDTQVEDATGPRYRRMQKQVQDRSMPPVDADVLPPPEPLSDDEVALLEAWFDAGAQAVGGVDCPD